MLSIRNGRKVIIADAGDHDSWQRGISGPHQIKFVFLAMSHAANLAAAQRISQFAKVFTIAATARFDDEIAPLKEAGVDLVFNIYAEAGAGFADHVCRLVANKGNTFDLPATEG